MCYTCSRGFAEVNTISNSLSLIGSIQYQIMHLFLLLITWYRQFVGEASKSGLLCCAAAVYPVSLEAIAATHPAQATLILSVKFITTNEETYAGTMQHFQSLAFEKLLKTGERREGGKKRGLEAQ